MLIVAVSPTLIVLALVDILAPAANTLLGISSATVKIINIIPINLFSLIFIYFSPVNYIFIDCVPNICLFSKAKSIISISNVSLSLIFPAILYIPSNF